MTLQSNYMKKTVLAILLLIAGNAGIYAKSGNTGKANDRQGLESEERMSSDNNGGTFQGNTAKNNIQTVPQMEYVCELKVTCGKAYSIGKTQHGERVVIPITGGTFEGSDIKGIVLEGGADYQLVDKNKGRTELEAIYCIRTDDGVTIHVRNKGLLVTGAGSFYFRTVPSFEAPQDSRYDWLNNAIFICEPKVERDYISLKIWRIK